VKLFREKIEKEHELSEEDKEFCTDEWYHLFYFPKDIINFMLNSII